MEATVEFAPGTNYSVVFGFEERFRYTENMNWMKENWMVSFYYVAAYMILIFAGKHYMSSRPRFELRTALFLWNLFLATFSILGAMRYVPEMVYVLKNQGFQYSCCSNSYAQDDIVTAFWMWLFALSKVPELGDTVFIILRKQPLIFLHWYHHITVLLYTWYSVGEISATGRWFISMNYTVHAFMYSYYSLRALRFRIPKWVSILITSSQIAQMVVGLCVNIATYRYKSRGERCMVTYENINVSFLMYFSYFVLFVHFFYRAYLKRAGPHTQKKD